MTKKFESIMLDENTKISILPAYVDVGEIEELHSHEFMEIQYVQKGEILQEINGKEYICKTGDFMFFYVGDMHKYEGIQKTTIFNIIFSVELLDRMKINRLFPMQKKIETKINLPSEETNRLIYLINMMRKESQNKKEGFQYIINNCLQSIVCILLRYGYYDGSYNELTNKIIDMIENDCTLTVSEIANRCNFCSNYVSLIFKKNVGMTLQQYIINKRMMKACTLIKTTDLTIEQVMEAINLNNKTYFYNLFKQHFNMTPKQLRES